MLAFEKYDGDVRKVLHLALRYARGLNHLQAECEHAAIAILRHFPNFEISGKPRLLEALERHLSQYPSSNKMINLTFGPRLRSACQKAEAKASVENPLTVEDLWKALKKESTTLLLVEQETAEVAKKKKSDPKKSDGKHPDAKKAEEKKADDKNKLADFKDIKDFVTDLTEKVLEGKIDPIIGRHEEITQVIETLSRKTKNHPLLVGDPGVGKTAIVEGLAQRIVKGNVPDRFKGSKVLVCQVSELISGAKYRGEFEERLHKLIKFMETNRDKVILFIDEMHQLIGAGQQDGSLDAANILKPALARGDLAIIGATTVAESKKFIERDPAFERRMHIIMVAEPTPEQALSLLRQIHSRYAAFHGVVIEDEALQAAVTFAERYISERRFPDKALDLIDEAASRLSMSLATEPAVVVSLRDALAQANVEMEGVRKSKNVDPKILKGLVTKSERLSAELDVVAKDWQSCKALQAKAVDCQRKLVDKSGISVEAQELGESEWAADIKFQELPKITQDMQSLRVELQEIYKRYPSFSDFVSRLQVAEVVARRAGIPMEYLTQDTTTRLVALRETLTTRVQGQDRAVDRLLKAVRRSVVGIRDENRPQASLFFSGPTGVGKTEVCRVLASSLFHSSQNFLKLDMSEFKESHQLARLIGSPPGYVGFGKGGELTEFLRRRPYSLILCDEIEKAHPNIYDIFLQVLDDGRLTDSEGRTVSCRQAMFIFTSNLALTSKFAPDTWEYDEDVRKALQDTFRAEFVNRLDEVIVFNDPNRSQYEVILQRFLAELNEKTRSAGLVLEMADSLQDYIVDFGVHGGFGGRGLKRAFETYVVDAVTHKLLEKTRGQWIMDWQHGKVVWKEKPSAAA